LLLGGSEAISPIGGIRVILNAIPAGVNYRADSLQHGCAHLPELDQDRRVRGLVRREIREVLWLLAVHPLNRLEVGVLEQEGAPDQRSLLRRPLLHHEGEDWLEVSRR
jgi:hypothetical protein